MGFSRYIHAKNVPMFKHSAAASKQNIYLEGANEVERLACLSQDIYFPQHLLVLHFDKTHNESDTIKSTKVLHCNSSKL